MKEHLIDRRLFTERILPRLDFVLRPDGSVCWLWTGALRGGQVRKAGPRYGSIHVRPHGHVYVHRLLFNWLVRPLEEGEVVDHRHACGLGHCVNPRFLFATSPTENNRRAAALTNGNGRDYEWEAAF